MSLKKVRLHNTQQFIDDLKSVRDVLVYPSNTRAFLRVSKKEVLEQAQTGQIHYYMTDTIFRLKRMVMVIL